MIAIATESLTIRGDICMANHLFARLKYIASRPATMQSGIHSHNMKSRPITAFFAATAISVCLLNAQPANKITTPKEAFGFNLGDDYMVANYTQLEAHWKKMASESPRMKLESIGKTEEGRDQWMAIIT